MAGNAWLPRREILSGLSEESLRRSWNPGLSRLIRTVVVCRATAEEEVPVDGRWAAGGSGGRSELAGLAFGPGLAGVRLEEPSTRFAGGWRTFRRRTELVGEIISGDRRARGLAGSAGLSRRAVLPGLPEESFRGCRRGALSGLWCSGLSVLSGVVGWWVVGSGLSGVVGWWVVWSGLASGRRGSLVSIVVAWGWGRICAKAAIGGGWGRGCAVAFSGWRVVGSGLASGRRGSLVSAVVTWGWGRVCATTVAAGVAWGWGRGCAAAFSGRWWRWLLRVDHAGGRERDRRQAGNRDPGAVREARTVGAPGRHLVTIRRRSR